MICGLHTFINKNSTYNCSYNNKEKYIIGREYNDSLSEKNVIIILNESIYLPLVNMFGDLPTKLLYKCIVNKKQIDKSFSKVPVKMLDNSNKKNTLNLKAVSSYKLSDLQEIANGNNVSISENIDGKIKNKTKQKLYNELLLI